MKLFELFFEKGGSVTRRAYTAQQARIQVERRMQFEVPDWKITFGRVTRIICCDLLRWNGKQLEVTHCCKEV